MSASCVRVAVLKGKGVRFDSNSRSVVEFGGVDEIIDLFFAVVRDVGYNVDDEKKES